MFLSAFANANVDMETGVRYGVMNLNRLDGDTASELYAQATGLVYQKELDQLAKERPEMDEYELECELEHCEFEPDGAPFEYEGLTVGVSLLGGAPLLWVYKSPHTAKARLCSPCVPNAGDLDNLDEDGYETYTVPKDWVSNY